MYVPGAVRKKVLEQGIIRPGQSARRRSGATRPRTHATTKVTRKAITDGCHPVQDAGAQQCSHSDDVSRWVWQEIGDHSQAGGECDCRSCPDEAADLLSPAEGEGLPLMQPSRKYIVTARAFGRLKAASRLSGTAKAIP